MRNFFYLENGSSLLVFTEKRQQRLSLLGAGGGRLKVHYCTQSKFCDLNEVSICNRGSTALTDDDTQDHL